MDQLNQVSNCSSIPYTSWHYTAPYDPHLVEKLRISLEVVKHHETSGFVSDSTKVYEAALKFLENNLK